MECTNKIVVCTNMVKVSYQRTNNKQIMDGRNEHLSKPSQMANIRLDLMVHMGVKINIFISLYTGWSILIHIVCEY